MVPVLKEEYFSKADSFILPLTGLPRSKLFDVKSFLFWEDYSIEDFKLIVTYSYDDKENFLEYCRKSIFPVLDRKGYLLETYDLENSDILLPDKEGILSKKIPFEKLSVFVLDMSEWAMDIEMFLAGRYSKFSKKAKDLLDSFHTSHRKGKERFPLHIQAILYPNEIIEAVDKRDTPILGRLTPIQYVAKEYGLNLTDLQEIGELGSIYQIKEETLTIGHKSKELSSQV